MSAADDLGETLAKGTNNGPQTVSAQVVDVTETGVNLDYQGLLLLNVSCADSYRNRQRDDWVAVRRGTVPVVLWRLGGDPGETEEDTIREMAEEAAADLQVVRAVTWGTSGPAGSGWQTTTTLHVRKTAAGKVELYAQLGAETDPSPTAPATRAPSPVTISPTDSGTWRNSRPDEYASTPTQGDWTGRGNRRGAWFYGTAIEAACSGKTVASMKVAFTRKAGAGVNAKRPMHLYLHDETSPPAGHLTLPTGPEELLLLSAGAKGVATLPSSWRTALASGSMRGLAIYSSGPTDYMSVTDGRITITFSA